VRIPWQRRRAAPAPPPHREASELWTAPVLERPARIEELTLLLCDIRGFTQISEQLSPQETVTFVNTYLDAVCPPIVASGGVIDKFMGDGVLAFFEGGGHAGRALEAARRILASVERSPRSGEPIRVGVALHTGEVLIGSIGPRTRRETTIISDAVNTLTRLEELNKTFGSVIVASARTLSQVAEPDRAGFSGPETISLRGRAEPVTVHHFKA
jgi:class 3 adenylate cyclase